MPCVYPIECWRGRKKNDNGKRPVTFKLQEAFSDQPLALPCGKCVGCRRDRAAAWTVRNYHEFTQHSQTCFLTLTYSDPPPEKISKRDLQLFFKRLRKSIDVPIRYFATGEYGERTHRPHYHALIFGADFKGKSYPLNGELYGSTFIDKSWTLGTHSLGNVSYSSIAYVSGYVLKKGGDNDTFNLMSTRPAIGSTWLTKHYDELCRTGFVTIDGNKLAVPKKYLEFEPEKLDELARKRKQYYTHLSPDQVSKQRQYRPSRERNYQGQIDRRIEKL